MARLDPFLRLVVDQKASDLHFVAGSRPIIRHNGELLKIPFRELAEAEARSFLYEIMTREQRELFEVEQDIDFAYDLPGVGRFRANLFVQRRGVGAVFRVIPEAVPSLARMGLAPALRQILHFNNGLVLFTGPTGCGKTTTQAALINEINRTRRAHILTIEDPIEFLHPTKRSLVTQRQVGRHVSSFAAALRSALREAPDVLLVGEMRDLETVSLAISAAETGVLVFGTLHTGSAANAFDRIVDMYPDEQGEPIRGVLSVIVRAVVAQRLVRRADRTGRVAAMELLFNSVAVANMVREGKTHQLDALLQRSGDPRGGLSLDRSLLRHVASGAITLEEALNHARFPATFEQAVREELGDAHR